MLELSKTPSSKASIILEYFRKYTTDLFADAELEDIDPHFSVYKLFNMMTISCHVADTQDGINVELLANQDSFPNMRLSLSLEYNRVTFLLSLNKFLRAALAMYEDEKQEREYENFLDSRE